LDWFKAVDFKDARDAANIPSMDPPLVPSRLLEEMHLVTSDLKKSLHGFKAFRYISWHIPLLLLMAPFMYIPGIPWLGQKIYLWVARNRFNLVPCKDGICHLPISQKKK
jgi:predicted DCC family thiol-disulfide oxidoreductase YuxK